MGAERKSDGDVGEEEKRDHRLISEAGHAIVGRQRPREHDPIYKVTTCRGGRALGVTMFLPEEDRYSHSRKMACCRTSARCLVDASPEEMVLGPDGITTGASNDIERATRLARNMVTKWGLSEKLVR